MTIETTSTRCECARSKIDSRSTLGRRELRCYRDKIDGQATWNDVATWLRLSKVPTSDLNIFIGILILDQVIDIILLISEEVTTSKSIRIIQHLVEDRWCHSHQDLALYRLSLWTLTRHMQKAIKSSPFLKHHRWETPRKVPWKVIFIHNVMPSTINPPWVRPFSLHYAVAFQLLGPIQCAMADRRGHGSLVSLFLNVCDSTKLWYILWLKVLAPISSNVLLLSSSYKRGCHIQTTLQLGHNPWGSKRRCTVRI